MSVSVSVSVRVRVRVRVRVGLGVSVGVQLRRAFASGQGRAVFVVSLVGAADWDMQPIEEALGRAAEDEGGEHDH